MNKFRAFQAIAMGMLFASVSAFMPSAITTSKKIAEAYFSQQYEEVGFSNISNFDKALSITYIFLVFMTGYFGYRWERNSVKAIEAREQELDTKMTQQAEHSEFIMNYLHTMPPQKYLAQFEKTYLAVSVSLAEIKENSDTFFEDESDLINVINDCEAQIYRMNEALIRLTKQWDTQGTVFDETVEYRLNIMAHCNAQDAVDRFVSEEYEWKHSERFFMASSPEGITSDVDGVLFVDKRLNVHHSASTGAYTNIECKTPIALPVTHQPSDFPNQNLPGAPKAFSTNQTQYIECCRSAIHDEIENIEHISTFMKNELKLYYCKENFAQSIISFPLHRAGYQPYGVLNIYRNQNHLAKRNEYDFMALMKPIILTISEAIYELYSYRSELFAIQAEKINQDTRPSVRQSTEDVLKENVSEGASC